MITDFDPSRRETMRILQEIHILQGQGRLLMKEDNVHGTLLAIRSRAIALADTIAVLFEPSASVTDELLAKFTPAEVVSIAEGLQDEAPEALLDYTESDIGLDERIERLLMAGGWLSRRDIADQLMPLGYTEEDMTVKLRAMVDGKSIEKDGKRYRLLAAYATADHAEIQRA